MTKLGLKKERGQIVVRASRAQADP